MLIYYESKIKDLPLTKEIFNKFWNCEKIEIQHYKNLFDKNLWNYKIENLIILAKQEHISILNTPNNYWFTRKSFFIKPSLNYFFSMQILLSTVNFQKSFSCFLS